MTQADSHSVLKELNFEVSYLIARYGRTRALVAILRTFWKGKGRPPDNVAPLNNHLRRDIGIPELPEATNKWWSMRF